MQTRTRIRLAALLIVVVGILAYANSFQGAFVFDDILSITENPRILTLDWPWQFLHSSRPLVEATLALNYAAGGLNPWGYHLVNLLIHLIGALALFGIVRRTLEGPALQGRFGRQALPLALVIALLWLVHPLQTQAVTYLIQRGESLMGMCYLLTLYAALRSFASERRPPVRWWVLAAVLCALGMASKPVMVSAPLVVLLYDRLFCSESLRAAWRRSWGLYLGLAATWSIFFLLMTLLPLGPTVGFSMSRVSAAQYAMTQPSVILHYLRLAAWPHPLCIDYAWQVARTAREILPAGLVVGALLAGTGWALRRRSPWGFLGAWFFLILAPTSSIVPVADLCVEHRMYLPLAAVVTLAVLGAYAAGERILRVWAPAERRAHMGREAALLAAVAAVGTFGCLTHLRNLYYANPLGLWQATAQLRPINPRAHCNMGTQLIVLGRTEEALEPLRQAIALYPPFARAHQNLGIAMVRLGRYEESLPYFAEALRLRPGAALPECYYGNALAALGRTDEAIIHYHRALEIDPDLPDAHYNLAHVLASLGKSDEAMAEYQRALDLAQKPLPRADQAPGLGSPAELLQFYRAHPPGNAR